jgi:hypothetical protein
MEPKVYVTLGFHVNFYHSWRGDTPDEAGFGTDIRVVRRILEILNDANEGGLQARGYWDTEVYWTFENILPNHAPDIIEGIRLRVEKGQDEIIVGPYNNGANHASTEDELRAAIALSLENPRGSGLKQIFGKVAPYYRSQESMQTAGQNRIFLEEGIEGVLHYYAGIPFNTLSTFIPVLPIEQHYNPLWLKCAPEDPPIILWPCFSMGDILNHISLEMWLLELRRLQRRGKVHSDLLLHLNIDADAETWLSFNLPKAFSWFPNSGGLVEFIQAVNKYPWAEFTVPSEYIQNHPPLDEILVRQDLADGCFDGNTSWAEKYGSLQLWSILERSRLHSYRAHALANRVEPNLRQNLHKRLWHGVDSSFFQRMIGLSTTHFGMSTPIVNEERQARAESILERAYTVANQAEREAIANILDRRISKHKADYLFEVYNYPRGRDQALEPTKMAVRIPVILPPEIDQLTVKDALGEEIQASLINVKELPDGHHSGEIAYVEQMTTEEQKVCQAIFGKKEPVHNTTHTLQNPWIEVDFSPNAKLTSLRFKGQEIAGDAFLQPFITYRKGRKTRTWPAENYTFENLGGEHWDGLSRVRIKASIPMDSAQGQTASHIRYTFSLFDELPYLFVDVEVRYAYITPHENVQNILQKLRRLLDLNWIEVAPFQMLPTITAPAENPLKVWKHNYLGITSSYELNYGNINPKNKNLDAFNHQVTAGWVAISNREHGILIAENTEDLTSMAFCPMRLREADGIQHLYLNPFGTYFGKQLDYSHMPGNGLGAEITGAVSSALNSNAPSFNGQNCHFSLMLAPYLGDAPPQNVRADAAAFFYPFGVFYRKSPTDIEATLPEDLRALMEARKKEDSLVNDSPIAAPTSLLANPSKSAVTLVWDAPREGYISGYEVRLKGAGEFNWQTELIPSCTRWSINELVDGEVYSFQIRAFAGERTSAWTQPISCIPRPVEKVLVAQTASKIPAWTLLRLAASGILHGIITRWLPKMQ